MFPNRGIGLNFFIEFPSRSPDLTACDLFLWSWIRSKVYSDSQPRDTQVLCQRITHDFAVLSVEPDVVIRVITSMAERGRRLSST